MKPAVGFRRTRAVSFQIVDNKDNVMFNVNVLSIGESFVWLSCYYRKSAANF